MLSIKDITLRRGDKDLFINASTILHKGEKVCIVGRNGTGKSSLIQAILGQVHLIDGDINKPKNLTIAHLKQEIDALEQKAVDYVLDGHQPYRDIEAKLNQASSNEDLIKYQEAFQHLDGYRMHSHAAKLLNGLGFKDSEINNEVKSFSGGWRMRLNLAQCLINPADILLLDEPTNHLDLDALIWLERFLKKSNKTLIIISHDKTFINQVCDVIWHIEQASIHRYKGNFDDFERLRAEKLALQEKNYQKQQAKIKHLQHFIDRFKAKATKARQAQSRIKALDKMSLVCQVQIDSPFSFEFSEVKRTSSPMLDLIDVSLGYDHEVVLDKVNLSLQFGERVGLLGHNGQGKSTLLKALSGKLKPLSGEMLKAKNHLNIAYYAQHQIEQLTTEESALWHLEKCDPKAKTVDLRSYLGRFAFSHEMTLRPVEHFSGGEKARLVLALLVYQKPNLLLLDEPTNHLDIDMREALELALQSYEGSLIIISHDRHLLEATVDEFYLVDNQKVSRFDGCISDYQQWLKASKKESSQDKTSPHKEKTKSSKADKNRLKKIETLLSDLNKEKQSLEAELSLDATYQDKDKLEQLLAKQADNHKKINELEEEWFLLQE